MNTTSVQSIPLECKPLMEVANLDIYLGNPFRVTGLPVDASLKEVSRHADKLKMLEELGHGAGAHTAAFALNPPPSVDKIREVIARLKDPEKRLIDEFFWFWPEEFGESSKDEAIQAVARGDRNEAFQYWVDRERDPKKGFIATHNLAILHHLVAIDWTLYHFSAVELDSKRETEIKGYWESALKHWKFVNSDDRIWDLVKTRIRSLDDPRVTTGLARRMESLIPSALNTVNAEIALKFAEIGKIDWAKKHIHFINTAKSSDSESIMSSVLSPVKGRLEHQLKDAEESTKRNPKLGYKITKKLIEHCRPQLYIFELFHGQKAKQINDIYDKVAITCLSCIVDYQKKTGDNDSFVEILRSIIPFATSPDVCQRVQRNISIGEDNLLRESLDPFYKRLESLKTPRDKLHIVQNELMPQLAQLAGKYGNESNQVTEFANAIAGILRDISIKSYNEHDDLETAQAATLLAIKLCKDQTLKTRLDEDQKQLSKNALEEIQHNLHLEIRSDVIEINKNLVSYNGITIPSNTVTGVKCGVFRQYTNGVQSSCSYLIGIAGSSGQIINIECKRFFRSESQAKSDYESILNSLYYHIIGALAKRITTSVLNGGSWTLDSCKFNARGMTTTVGLLAWKKEVFIPYSEINYSSQNGGLKIITKCGIERKFEFRSAWNAIIFERITKGVVQGKI